MEPRNYKSGASETPPLPLENPSIGFPTPGNPGAGIPATVPGAFWHYSLAEEMRNVILQAGLTPDYEDLTQFSQAINALISSKLLPVGTVLLRSGDVVPAGFFKRNGAEISRATYSTHWAYVQTVTNFIDQATKDANPDVYAGYYGDGDGSTTYTLPDDRGEFHRVWDDGRGIDIGRTIGSSQSHAVEQMTGTIASMINASNTFTDADATGVFTATDVQGATTNVSSGSGGDKLFTFNFDASAQVNTASETRPRSTALMSIEKY